MHVRPRRTRPGPEAELLRAMIKAEFVLGKPLPAVFFHEPDLPTGLPDLVAVYLGNANLCLSRARLRLNDRHVRLLHYLHTCGPTADTVVAQQLRLKPEALEELVAQLQSAELVSRRQHILRARPLSRTFAVKYIIAIEAKIRNWAGALQQAAANHWFASQSYILVPQSRVMHRIRERARPLGIGVLVFDGQRVQIAVRAKTRDIPSSYGSWLFNEWALRRVGRP